MSNNQSEGETKEGADGSALMRDSNRVHFVDKTFCRDLNGESGIKHYNRIFPRRCGQIDLL